MSTFTNTEKTDIRRFLGYPVIGTELGVDAFGFAPNDVTHLERRMITLTDEEMKVVRTFLNKLEGLEQAILDSADNLDTLQIAALTNSPNEVMNRAKLFDYWRGRLATFLNVPLDPTRGGRRGRGFMVV